MVIIFKALMDGALKSITEGECRFVELIRINVEPFTRKNGEAYTWSKYSGRNKVELKSPGINNLNYSPESDSFSSLEMAK